MAQRVPDIQRQSVAKVRCPRHVKPLLDELARAGGD